MRLLITGASGFIGSYLARYFVEAGYQVFGVVRTGAAPHGVTTIRCDLADCQELPEVDVIIHAAAASPGTGGDIVRSNVMATERLLKIAKTERIIYLSSVSLHGRPQHSVIAFDTPIVETDLYGACKLVCEKLIAESNIPAVSLRLPGVIGTGAKRPWLARVAHEIVNGGHITIYSPEFLFNNAVHLSDLAKFIDNLLERDWLGFSAMPLGAGTAMPVRNLVEFLASAMGREVLSVKIGAPDRKPFWINSSFARIWGYAPMSIEAMLTMYAKEAV